MHAHRHNHTHTHSHIVLQYAINDTFVFQSDYFIIKLSYQYLINMTGIDMLIKCNKICIMQGHRHTHTHTYTQQYSTPLSRHKLHLVAQLSNILCMVQKMLWFGTIFISANVIIYQQPFVWMFVRRINLNYQQ